MLVENPKRGERATGPQNETAAVAEQQQKQKESPRESMEAFNVSVPRADAAPLPKVPNEQPRVRGLPTPHIPAQHHDAMPPSNGRAKRETRVTRVQADPHLLAFYSSPHHAQFDSMFKVSVAQRFK